MRHGEGARSLDECAHSEHDRATCRRERLAAPTSPTRPAPAHPPLQSPTPRGHSWATSSHLPATTPYPFYVHTLLWSIDLVTACPPQYFLYLARFLVSASSCMESFAYGSLAQIRILLLPVGNIRRSSFERWVQEIRNIDTISLGDLSTDVKDERCKSTCDCSRLCYPDSFPPQPGLCQTTNLRTDISI